MTPFDTVRCDKTQEKGYRMFFLLLHRAIHRTQLVMILLETMTTDTNCT